MRILSLILLSFVISAAVETNCETLGYEYISDDSSFQETCESWLVCPANANYKICTKLKTEYIYTENTCPNGVTCEREKKYRLIGCEEGYSEKYDDNGNLSACEKTSNCPGSPLRCVSNACEFTMCNDGTYDYSGRCSEGFEKYTSIGGVLSDLMRTDLHCALCNCAKSVCKTNSTAGATSYVKLENGGYVHLSCESSSTTDANGCLFCSAPRCIGETTDSYSSLGCGVSTCIDADGVTRYSPLYNECAIGYEKAEVIESSLSTGTSVVTSPCGCYKPRCKIFSINLSFVGNYLKYEDGTYEILGCNKNTSTPSYNLGTGCINCYGIAESVKPIK